MEETLQLAGCLADVERMQDKQELQKLYNTFMHNLEVRHGKVLQELFLEHPELFMLEKRESEVDALRASKEKIKEIHEVLKVCEWVGGWHVRAHVVCMYLQMYCTAHIVQYVYICVCAQYSTYLCVEPIYLLYVHCMYVHTYACYFMNTVEVEVVGTVCAGLLYMGPTSTRHCSPPLEPLHGRVRYDWPTGGCLGQISPSQYCPEWLGMIAVVILLRNSLDNEGIQNLMLR